MSGIEVMESEMSARKVAALLCCKKLFETKELNPVNLLPWPKDHWILKAKDLTAYHQLKDHPKAGTEQRVQLFLEKGKNE